MPSFIFSLAFVFLINRLIEPTGCALQNRQLDDITSLRHEFPSIIRKIKVIVNQFRCPKGWTHFGGSCYYLSRKTSISTTANHTCRLLHSNHSNLMQIRNTVELFYALHVLARNNLSILMIDIDRNFLKEKRMKGKLAVDQSQWQRMREKFREERVTYYKLKGNILDEFNSAGLCISRRTKKVKNTISNNTLCDSLDTKNGSDEFERMENIQGICDRIEWNITDYDSTVYKLTTSLISNKMICLLSNIEPDVEYRHICEYVLDFCFENIVCGKHGRCVNTISGFKCSCSFLYDGPRCERISTQGQEIIIGVILILILNGLSITPTRRLLRAAFRGCYKFCRRRGKQKKENNIEDGTHKMVDHYRRDGSHEEDQAQHIMDQGHQNIAQEPILPKATGSIKNFNKRDLVRLLWVGGLSILFLTSLLSITTITHLRSFKYDIVNNTKLDSLFSDRVLSVGKCARTAIYHMENLVFCPIAVAFLFVFSWLIKRERRCLHRCDGRPGLIIPIEPFRTENRFTTAIVFGILAFEVLKIFDEFLFSTNDLSNHGILVQLLVRLGLSLVIGLRYYPVLASLQLHNVLARFFVCLYILSDIIYKIIREGFCLNLSPLSRYYSTLEEAKLRTELGTWFIIYGLLKKSPHFILLSYIAAELCVRFAYDAIYIPCKKKQSIWSPPIVPSDESAFAKYYVTKLFRRHHRATRTIYPIDGNIDTLEDFEQLAQLQKKANSSRIKKFFDFLYRWDDNFRFTTIATCTYTVAFVFLYYLACTLVFIYILRTTDHISSITYSIESTFNIRLFSWNSQIIISAISSVTIIAFQLCFAMNNYKRDKLQLLKGVYTNIPSAINFSRNTIVSNSVHYFGFLVGHIACGFIILFHVILFLLIVIRLLALQIRYIELVFAITIPILVTYLLIMASISIAGRLLFTQPMTVDLNIRNRKIFANFIYFNFFIDCFLGITSCIIRLIKATFLNIIYMTRLDYSILGRQSEKFDLGFAIYVSYLHMEVTHTNPVMLAFCYSFYEDFVQRRRPKYDDDEMNIELKPRITMNVNESMTRKAKLRTQEIASSITDENNATNTDDNDIEEEEEQIPELHVLTTIRRRKQARFRWFLAYTMLHNYHLCNLRKQVHSRLARLYIERSYLIEGQQDATATTNQQSVEEIETPESLVINSPYQ